MSSQLNEAKKTKSRNYIRYGSSVTKKENTKEKEKVFAKHQANAMNAHGKQLLLKTPSKKLGRSE